MCLIIISYRLNPDYPLVIAANRDESYTRPTQSAGFWEDQPCILAGRDLQQHGSWLGINRQGRFAAVTNYRSGSTEATTKISRGKLVSDYLKYENSSQSYLQLCMKRSSEFNGYNLLLGDLDKMYFLNNGEMRCSQIKAGVFGISNGDFDVAWPKVERAKQQFQDLSEEGQLANHDAMLTLMTDKHIPADESLPDTGVGLELERALAPIFINRDGYGTRSSTVLTIDKNNLVRFTERTYDNTGVAENTSEYEFIIEARS